MIRKALTILFIATLAFSIGGCKEPVADSDAKYASKYQAAVESISNVERVEVEYKTTPGMSRGGGVRIFSDTSDSETMMRIVEEALRALVKAGEGDPDVSLPLRVFSADKETAVGPISIGYNGITSLTGYEEFLGSK